MARKNQKEIIAFKTLDENGVDRIGRKFEVGKKYSTDQDNMFEAETFPIRQFRFNSMMRTKHVRCVLSGKLRKEDGGGGTIYGATKLEIVEEVDPLYIASYSIRQIKEDSKTPARIGYTDIGHDYKQMYSTDIGKSLITCYDGSLVSSCSFAVEIRVTGHETKVSSTGEDSNIFIGGERNTIGSTGARSIILAWGRDHHISVSGENSTVCVLGEDIVVSSSDNFANVVVLGVNNRISTTGDEAEICSSGDNTIINAAGERSIIKSIGKDCTILASGDSIVSAGLGSWITLTKTRKNGDGNAVPVDVVSWCVDGDCIMPGVYYKLSDDDFEPVRMSGSVAENIE